MITHVSKRLTVVDSLIKIIYCTLFNVSLFGGFLTRKETLYLEARLGQSIIKLALALLWTQLD